MADKSKVVDQAQVANMNNVKSNGAQADNAKPQLTFDQLKQVAAQLQRKNVELQKQLNAMNSVTLRLQLLFKVIDSREAYSEEFVSKCVAEVEGLLTIPEQETKATTESTTAESAETTEATAEA